MATLQPRKVEIRDVVHWWKAAFELVNRRIAFYFFVVAAYCFFAYFGMQAIVSITFYLPLLSLSLVYLFYAAFLLYFALACFVVLAHCADKSLYLSLSRLIGVLMPEQKTLLKMAAMALLVGTAIWALSLSLDPQRGLIAGGEAVVEKMVASQDDPFQYIFQITAAMLYFLLLSLYALRIFFSIPLVVFHELSYREAKQMSQRAIIVNIAPMSLVLVTWAILFLVALRASPILAIALFPLLGSFIYVGYRHVFIGDMENERGRKVVREVVKTAVAGIKK